MRRTRSKSSSHVNWANVWLLTFFLVAFLSVATTFHLDRRPSLGLDLQGGASVVLAPSASAQNVTDDTLDEAINVIRSRVDGVGVAEPDIQRQGRNIIIQLPGVTDTDRVLSLVGQTAQLRFRPVLGGAAQGDALTSREDDKAEVAVTLPQQEKGVITGAYRLGPSLADGTIVDTARAVAPGTTGVGSDWSVDFELTGRGSGVFDGIAKKCYPTPDPEACPQSQIAIVLDGVVRSAPRINTDSFGGRGQITGTFTEREAKDLALVLRYGSLPIELETQSRQTVSASLGKDSLRAGLVAGAVGLGLVLLYMIVYYRALGLVVALGLVCSGALLWSIFTALSVNYGLAFSLAGATGVIVSVGVTVDSYIVFFERLKDDVKQGRAVRTSVSASFTRAFRTILVADGTSFIGAAILYSLTVGPVRGFAFTLAVSTALDVIVAWAFTRPMVLLLGRSRAFTQMRFIGVARGLAAKGTA